MIILKRNMQIDESTKTAKNNIDEHLTCCQASLNSGGNITLRNFDRSNKNKDEIIILSKSETNAIFELMYQINNNIKNIKERLPF